MNRTEQEYREALDGLRFSEDAKRRMMDHLMEQKEEKTMKKRNIRPLRTGLIAAALCLALAGTAFAATAAYQLMIQLYSDKEIDGGHYAGFSVYGDFTQFPLSAFSPELIAACEENRDPFGIVQPRFSTRKEVQDFLGHAIPCIWAKGDDVWVKDGNDMSGLSEDYEYHTVLWQNNETRQLDGVQVLYYLDSTCGMSAIVEMTIFAETMEPPEDWDGSFGGMLEYQNRRVEQLESYTMPNGAVAEVVMIHAAEEPGHRDSQCYGNFLYEGISYQVRVNGRQDTPTEEFAAQLHALLDSFE